MTINFKYDTAHICEKEPIAIIGIGCHLPGGATSPEAFWKLLIDGVDAITEVPVERWNSRSLYDQDRGKPGKIYTHRGGFIENIDQFDAQFFGISPKEAERIDPQQRILLEVAYEALEDAGQVPEHLSGSKTGVFIGISSHDYIDIQTSVSDRTLINAYTNQGGAMSIAANRISYVFDFKGPSMAVDTACSSALVAVHLACQSIWNQESTQALAGGVNAVLKPEGSIGFSKASMLSPDGKCKSFDASADGFVRSEGAGIVILKPLAQAIADQDLIYAVIRGTAVNSDGHTNGMTVPSKEAQEAALHEAYRQAGISPDQVQYVEAHGTGTSVGDPIEANAIGNVLGKNRQPNNKCIIGSVKTNIGHLESAAGIAGLIKAALALKHGQIPPNLHFVSSNPKIPLEQLHLRVPQTIEPWPNNGHQSRIAGVNSFGFGGTNAHVVLSDAEILQQTSLPEYTDRLLQPTAPSQRQTLLLPLSAKSPEALAAVAKLTDNFLATASSRGVSLLDICYSASLRRGHHDYRLALVSDSFEEMAEQLQGFLAGETRLAMSSGCLVLGKSPKLAFVFSGMGQQWWAMGHQLLESEPVFRESIKQCDQLLRQYTDWSLWDELRASEEHSRINETVVAQCSIFAVQVALSALWRSWGIIPDAIVGHSVGEVAAAHVAGVLSLEDAIRVIFHRSRLQATAAGLGKMLAIAFTQQEAETAIAGYEDKVSIAAINSLQGLTLSGDTQALEEIAQSLEQKEIFCRFLKVEVPYHSILMEPLKAELAQSLEEINPQPATIPLFSTVTGQQIDGPEINGLYWGQNMREPVLFAKAIDGIMQAGYDLFLEIGAHPVLASYISECFAIANKTTTVLASLRRKEPEQAMMLASVGKLYTLGYPIDWHRFYPQKGQFVRLPSYPWQRERYWSESLESQQARLGQTALRAMFSTQVHPLLGCQLKSAQPVWDVLIDKEQLTYLEDHRIQGVAVYPGAAYVEMALAAAIQTFGNEPYVLEEIEFLQALPLPDNQTHSLQLILDSSQTTFDIYGKTKDTEDSWTRYATGKFSRTSHHFLPNLVVLDEYKSLCSKEINPQDCYQQFQEMGLEYGPSFQGIEQLFCGEKQSLAKIKVHPELLTEVEDYQLHPAILDACFQALLGALFLDDKTDKVYLPIEISRFQVYARPGVQLWSYTQIVEQTATSFKGDIRLLDDAGKVLVEIQGFRCQSLERRQQVTPAKIDNCLHEYQWQLKLRPDQELVDLQLDYLPSPRKIAELVQPEADRLSKYLRIADYYSVVEPKLDVLCTAYILEALEQLGWQPQLHQQVDVETLTEKLGVADQHKRLLGRILEILQEDGVLSQVNNQWSVRQILELKQSDQIWQELITQHPSYLAELTMLGRCGQHLASVLRGDVDPLGLIFPEGSLTTSEHLYQDSPSTRIYNLLVQNAIATLVSSLPKERTIRILEIGAGTGSLASYLLPILPSNRSQYVFTDVSQVFTVQAQQKFQEYPFVEYQLLDIEKDPIAQGFLPYSFDLILASDALHATTDLRQTLENVKQLLASQGLLVLLELTKPPRWHDLVFGLLKGWWLFSDLELRPSHPLLSFKKWHNLLQEVGFAEIAGIRDTEANEESLHTVILATAPNINIEQESASRLKNSYQPDKQETWLIFADNFGVSQQLANLLKQDSKNPIFISPGTTFSQLDDNHFQIRTEHLEDIQQVLETVNTAQSPCRGIVHLWSINTPPIEETTISSLESTQTVGVLSALNLVQALEKVTWNDSPCLFLVTRGLQSVGESVKSLSIAQSSLWGLGRVIVNEHPDLRCTMVDLSSTTSASEIQSLFDELCLDDREDEIALRGKARYVNRLVRISSTNALTEANQAFRLEITTPGILDNLILRATTRQKPGPKEVEIQVYATGLNFKDVAKAMDLLADVNLENNFSGQAIGLECAGIITAIGSEIEEFQIGDEVVAVAPNSFANYVTTDACLVVHKPASLSFEEAATIPLVFLTAYYALHYLGRIRKGERVLIHAGAGGVGIAAIQIALAAGAEIFATAGSSQKREFLRNLGVKHVMDSRSLAFADQIMQITNGKGVDIVLNSLAGEAIPKSLSVLGAYGRFIEIGKRDIDSNSKLGLRPFQKNLSFFALDFDRFASERPDYCRSLLRELMQHFHDGSFHPLPHRVFPISRVVSAFRYMAQAKHIGKIVVDLRDPKVKVAPLSEETITFGSDATYLLTGGLGGFGLAVAQWLVERGARHLVLMGRSNVLSTAASTAIEAMKKFGAEVVVAQADVTQPQQVETVLADISESMPPLRGIIHGAMVLDDALVLQLNSERMQKVMAPKMLGAWNLHTQTLNTPLDFFLLFSSFTSLVGNPGQGNYVAASSFIDALAHHRHAIGLPALTINWGFIADVGYVARNADVAEHLKRMGNQPLPLRQVLKKMGELLLQPDVAQAAIVDIDWHRWCQVHFSGAGGSPRFSYLNKAAATEQIDAEDSEENSSYGDLLSVTPAEREQFLVSRIREQVAKIMGIALAKLDITRSLLQVGLDSLMAVELSNRFKSEMGVNIPTMKIMQGLSISQLAEISLEQLALASIKLSESPSTEESNEDMEEITL
ncbi:type I polyketide synthase [Nostoc sp. NMS4]|uniref:type I polyketide synthase n=1 Tax=Nostoc sp. NMS4 TaxID=2815390 RepID=UPI0025E43B6E|nr:type I polyketide synthase [Nostoc sp. NMS4]MBN3925716.1 SDR family NAD(P)-dependent oxidoreductase [Nostoc sp. NMS4]